MGVVRRGEVPPFGACADGPKDVSDAANGRGRGSRRSTGPMSAGASRAPPARNSIAKTFSIVGGLTSTRKPCRRAAATTPPTSGAISASFRLPKLGGGLPDTEAIPHGITALPGMCAMTQTAPRSCWRRGRASTTGCPTVVRTMGVRGGKRKNGEGQNPPRFVSGVDPPTCESCRPCFGGQHRQQG